MAKNSGLGRGLGALLGESAKSMNETAPSSENQVIDLKITELEPGKSQPRKSFDQEKIAELAKSIQEYGIVQPIIVKKKENGYYQIIAGERRWRAARSIGLKKVPVIIRDYQDEKILEIALIENLQREDLNPIEEALGYRQLMDELSYTQEELSLKLGKSRPQITNTLRLLGLSDQVQKLIIQKELSNGHGRCLLAVSDPKTQLEVAQIFIDKGFSVRNAENYVKKLNTAKPKEEIKDKQDIVCMEIEHSLSNLLGTKVHVMKNKSKGKIEIEYYNKEDLERILQIIGN